MPGVPRKARRRLVTVTCAASLLVSAGEFGARTTSPARAQSPQPNVVIILTDDQRWDTLWAMRTVRRQIADKGVTFSRGYVVNPLCCPSRASILTGQYSHTTRVYTNLVARFGGFPAFDDSSTIATWLDGAGYNTALIGKYLNHYMNTTYIPPGWDYWFAFSEEGGAYYKYKINDNGSFVNYGQNRSDYSTDVFGSKAVNFINSVPGGDPLFLYFAPFAPHAPAMPAARDKRYFDSLDPYRPPNYNEKDVSDKPGYIRRLKPLNKRSRTHLDRRAQRQYETLLAVDDAVADILDALGDTNRLGDTMIIFMSDNGLSWGEHRWTYKLVPYEESIRVPLVIRYDAEVADPGDRNGRLALNIDLAPTIAEAAGVSAPGVEGRSLLPLLRGAAPKWRKSFLIENLRYDRGDGPSVPTYCAAHTLKSVYVAYSTGAEELYNLSEDRFELRNMAKRRPAVRRRMLRILRRLCDPPPPGYRVP